VIRAAAASAAAPRGATDLGVAADWVRAHLRRRSLVILLSDFRERDDAPARRPLAVVARGHDLVAALIEDPRERALVAAGGLRLAPAEPGARARRVALPTRRRQREAYAAAANARRDAVARRLRDDGAELVWLATDADPLHALVRFFRARGAARRARR
jgi:hypothetical protein